MRIGMVGSKSGVGASLIYPRGEDIYEDCFGHPAVETLRRFNEHFTERSLTQAELRLFLSSMAAFNRHTIGGIAILAGRLSDEILPHRPINGHCIGAYVLDAAVDEYGLRESITHVELGRHFAAYLGIPSGEIDARENACVAAAMLGDALFTWYREAPAAFALGVHIASEVTSVKEFMAWHDVFLKFPKYRLDREQPEFEYMRAHYVHEPDHINNARICVAKYLDVLPANGHLVQQGTRAYLELYQTMFHELDTLIFK